MEMMEKMSLLSILKMFILVLQFLFLLAKCQTQPQVDLVEFSHNHLFCLVII